MKRLILVVLFVTVLFLGCNTAGNLRAQASPSPSPIRDLGSFHPYNDSYSMTVLCDPLRGNLVYVVTGRAPSGIDGTSNAMMSVVHQPESCKP